MKFQFLCHSLILAAAVSSVSCGDDPKMVEKRDQQKAEITRLKGEVALIDEKLKNLPPDVTEELNAAKKIAESQSAEVAKLEEEVAALEEKKRSIESDFQAYQLKYKVR